MSFHVAAFIRLAAKAVCRSRIDIACSGLLALTATASTNRPARKRSPALAFPRPAWAERVHRYANVALMAGKKPRDLTANDGCVVDDVCVLVLFKTLDQRYGGLEGVPRAEN